MRTTENRFNEIIISSVYGKNSQIQIPHPKIFGNNTLYIIHIKSLISWWRHSCVIYYYSLLTLSKSFSSFFIICDESSTDTTCESHIEKSFERWIVLVCAPMHSATVKISNNKRFRSSHVSEISHLWQKIKTNDVHRRDPQNIWIYVYRAKYRQQIEWEQVYVCESEPKKKNTWKKYFIIFVR